MVTRRVLFSGLIGAITLKASMVKRLFRLKTGEVVQPEIICAKHPIITMSADGMYLFIDLAELGKRKLILYKGDSPAVVYGTKERPNEPLQWGQ